MKDKTLEQLTDEEFGTVIESFIEREAEGTDEIEYSTFFQLCSLRSAVCFANRG
jgi:hypothetical protein